MNNSEHTLSVLYKLAEIIEKMAQETFSVEEAAQYLKTTPESVLYYSKRQKQLSYINLGGKILFRRKDLNDFLEKKVKKGFVF